MLNLTKLFARSDDGSAAVEFSLIAPIFIALFYGVVELSSYNLLTRRAQMTANFSAEYISRDDDQYLTRAERFAVIDMWMLVNSTAYETNSGSGRTAYISRGFQSIDFETTVEDCEGLDCEYTPVPLHFFYWAPGGFSNAVKPTCAVIMVDEQTPSSGDKISEGMAGRSAIVTADYTFIYKPIIDNPFTEEKTISVNSVRKTRGGSPIIMQDARICI